MSSIREMNVTEGTYEKDFGENTIGVYSAISLRLMLQSFHTCTTIYSLLLPSPQMSSQLAAQSRPVVYLPRPENNIKSLLYGFSSICRLLPSPCLKDLQNLNPNSTPSQES